MAIGNAYLYRMPSGFPGMVDRQDQALLQPEVLDSVNGPTAYGTFVKMTAGKIVKLAGGEAVGDIRGIIARPYPVNETSTPGGTLGAAATPNLALPGDILKRGYINMVLKSGAPAKGDQVYVCINVAGGNAVGDVLTGTDGGNNIAVTNCFFMGAADGNNVVQVSYNVER